MITQSDVTMRTQVEMAMAQLTESQLGMLSQVRPQEMRAELSLMWVETLGTFLASSPLTAFLAPLQIFPRHVVDFMTEGGTAAQVPQEIARLARSHEEVSILFMDIVGEAGAVYAPYGMVFASMGDTAGG